MRNIRYSILLIALFLLAGCAQWLDVKPYDKIAEEELLSTE